MLAAATALTLATGGKFLAWEAPAPSRVLYVEGEMPDEQVQERFRQLQKYQKVEPGFLRVLTVGQQVNGIPALSTASGQRWLEDALGDVEALILDSISTLAWIATNDEENWLETLHWLNRLCNTKKLCIEFLHHAGKSGMQRGHSRAEDMLDLSVKLERDPEDEDEWCKFRLTYDKVRGDRTGVRNLDVEYRNGKWTHRTVDVERLKILQKYLAENPKASSHKILKAIGEELGVKTHRTILKLMKKLSATEDQETLALAETL
jgi:RecA-family ATPase